MRSRIILAATAAMLTLTSAAYAHIKDGTIKAYNVQQRRLVLENGEQFLLSPALQNTSLKVGDKVRVTWNTLDRRGIPLVQKITVQGQPTDTSIPNE